MTKIFRPQISVNSIFPTLASPSMGIGFIGVLYGSFARIEHSGWTGIPGKHYFVQAH